MNPFASPNSWPNAVDLVATIVFLALVILVPAAGYVFMFLDFRAHLRSLRRGIVHVSYYMHGVPGWARRDTPRTVAAWTALAVQRRRLEARLPQKGCAAAPRPRRRPAAVHDVAGEFRRSAGDRRRPTAERSAAALAKPAAGELNGADPARCVPNCTQALGAGSGNQLLADLSAFGSITYPVFGSMRRFSFSWSSV